MKFETYAVTRIKGAIIDELRSLDWVPRSVRARSREIERKATELEHKLQRAPTDEELAAALGMEMRRVPGRASPRSRTRRSSRSTRRGACPPAASPLSLIDTHQRPRPSNPADLLDVTELRDTLADAIARLPEREKIVIALYYYDGLTLREIGEVLGVTESRVSQLHTKAILRLKGRLQGTGRLTRASGRVETALPGLVRKGTKPMAHPDPAQLRNVAVLGHRGSGKTSLVEAMLFAAEATTRLGRVAEGTTVADFDDDEQRRGMSHLRVALPPDLERREGQPDRHARASPRSRATPSPPCGRSTRC